MSKLSKAQLLVIQGVEQGARFDLDEDEVWLGRGAQNAVRIHDTEVSRRHASLQRVEDHYVLSDQGSSNGSYVNGQPIRSVLLHNGDQIQVGRTVLLFTQTRDDEDSQPAADRIALVGRHDPEDRQNIVGQASVDASEALVAMPAEMGSSNLEQTLANLQVLYRIAEEAVRPSITLEQLLYRILEMTIDVSGADRGCMLLKNPQSGEIQPLVFCHRRSVDTTQRMPMSRSIVDYVLQTRQGVRTTDARTDTRFVPGQSIFQAGIREAICVPLQGRYELLGVMYVDISTPSEQVVLQGQPTNKFDEDLLRLMVAIGRQSALAVEDNRYEQALVKSERLAAIGQTITILSHHIKNILQGVRGGSYLIDMGLKSDNDDMVRKGWRIVEKNQNKIYNLVMDMLTFSKERQPALQRANLNDTVADVCELMQARAAELNVQLSWELAPQLPASSFDPEGIHRAVLNIVGNALDAVEGQEDGQVCLWTGYEPATRMLSVIVADNGPGIPAEVLSTLFNLFESTKGSRGTGIGLAVSQKIIREHGGKISVESLPGQGARFTLEWPLIEDDEHAPLDRSTLSH